MTGQEFDRIFDRKMNEAYTGFYSPATVKPALYKEAMIAYIQDTYKNMNEQQEYDKLRSLISTEQTFPLTASTVMLSLVNSYFHLLAFRANCIDYTFTPSITYTLPNKITTSVLTPLRTGEMVTILSTTYYVKQVGDTTTYELYTDALLTVAATLPTIPVGTKATRVVSYWGRTSNWHDRKIGQWGKPSIYIPRCEIANDRIKVYPDATSITIDYLKEPTVMIIPSDNVVNLEDTYPYNFLIGVADKAVEMMSKEVRDYGRFNVQLQQNQREQSSQII